MNFPDTEKWTFCLILSTVKIIISSKSISSFQKMHLSVIGKNKFRLENFQHSIAQNNFPHLFVQQ